MAHWSVYVLDIKVYNRPDRAKNCFKKTPYFCDFVVKDTYLCGFIEKYQKNNTDHD